MPTPHLCNNWTRGSCCHLPLPGGQPVPSAPWQGPWAGWGQARGYPFHSVPHFLSTLPAKSLPLCSVLGNMVFKRETILVLKLV